MSEKKKPAPQQPPSEEFLSGISDGIGTLTATCEFCNTTYFSTHGDYDEGELEELERKAKEDPEHYVSTSDEWQSLCSVGGKQYIYGCPCYGPRQYEDFIWAHRWKISKYLKAKAKANLEDAIREYRPIKAIPLALPDGPDISPKPRPLGSPRRVESSSP